MIYCTGPWLRFATQTNENAMRKVKILYDVAMDGVTRRYECPTKGVWVRPQRANVLGCLLCGVPGVGVSHLHCFSFYWTACLSARRGAVWRRIQRKDARTHVLLIHNTRNNIASQHGFNIFFLVLSKHECSCLSAYLHISLYTMIGHRVRNDRPTWRWFWAEMFRFESKSKAKQSEKRKTEMLAQRRMMKTIAQC